MASRSVRLPCPYHGGQVEQDGVEFGLGGVAQHVSVGGDEAVLDATFLPLKRFVPDSDPPVNLQGRASRDF